MIPLTQSPNDASSEPAFVDIVPNANAIVMAARARVIMLSFDGIDVIAVSFSLRITIQQWAWLKLDASRRRQNLRNY